MGKKIIGNILLLLFLQIALSGFWRENIRDHQPKLEIGEISHFFFFFGKKCLILKGKTVPCFKMEMTHFRVNYFRIIWYKVENIA